LYPVILKLGAFELRSYGLMLAISFILGIYWSISRAKKRGVDPNHVMDLSVLVIICSIVGSRILYVLFHLDEFRGHWTDTFNPFQSNGQIGIAGLTMLGGVILSIVVAIIYLKIKKIPFLKLADVMIPAFALGIFITRIGCYLNGCCWGLECAADSFWCVVFPTNSPAGSMFQGIPIIPTQLYSSLYGLLILVILVVAEKWKKFDGFVLNLFLILYGISRFVIDMFRYYESSMVVIPFGERGLSLNQAISLSMICAGAVLLVIGYVGTKKQVLTQQNNVE
jgi:phosphatidylglycerol---prolipoprotein diacylglyceryl transferase